MLLSVVARKQKRKSEMEKQGEREREREGQKNGSCVENFMAVEKLFTRCFRLPPASVTASAVVALLFFFFLPSLALKRKLGENVI